MSSVQEPLVPIVRIIPYLCSPFRPIAEHPHRPGGEMVDTRDLKSLGPKRPCGFDSRPGHEGMFLKIFKHFLQMEKSNN